MNESENRLPAKRSSFEQRSILFAERVSYLFTQIDEVSAKSDVKDLIELIKRDAIDISKGRVL